MSAKKLIAITATEAKRALEASGYTIVNDTATASNSKVSDLYKVSCSRVNDKGSTLYSNLFVPELTEAKALYKLVKGFGSVSDVTLTKRTGYKTWQPIV